MTIKPRRHECRMHFTADYREDVVLAEGTTVSLRLVRPDDKPRLSEILAGMSLHSRVMRFFIPRRHLNESELRQLTELDGVDHLALLALLGDESIGVARFVRLAPGSRVAEPALAIVDRFQARGLGRILLARLAAAARERAIERFAAEILPHNRPMLRLLHELDGSVPLGAIPSPHSITCTVDLSAAPTPTAVRLPRVA